MSTKKKKIHNFICCLIILLSVSFTIKTAYRKETTKRTFSQPIKFNDLNNYYEEQVLKRELLAMQKEALEYNIIIDLSSITYSIEPEIKSIAVANMNEKHTILGVCVGTRHVAFTKNIFHDIDLGSEGLRGIIYHEIGHCVYDLDHIDNVDSLMDTYSKLDRDALAYNPLLWEQQKRAFFLTLQSLNHNNFVLNKKDELGILTNGSTLDMDLRNLTQKAPFLHADALIYPLDNKNYDLLINLAIKHDNAREDVFYAKSKKKIKDLVQTTIIIDAIADFSLNPKNLKSYYRITHLIVQAPYKLINGYHL